MIKKVTVKVDSKKGKEERKAHSVDPFPQCRKRCGCTGEGLVSSIGYGLASCQ